MSKLLGSRAEPDRQPERASPGVPLVRRGLHPVGLGSGFLPDVAEPSEQPHLGRPTVGQPVVQGRSDAPATGLGFGLHCVRACGVALPEQMCSDGQIPQGTDHDLGSTLEDTTRAITLGQPHELAEETEAPVARLDSELRTQHVTACRGRSHLVAVELHVRLVEEPAEAECELGKRAVGLQDTDSRAERSDGVAQLAALFGGRLLTGLELTDPTVEESDVCLDRGVDLDLILPASVADALGLGLGLEPLLRLDQQERGCLGLGFCEQLGFGLLAHAASATSPAPGPSLLVLELEGREGVVVDDRDQPAAPSAHDVVAVGRHELPVRHVHCALGIVLAGADVLGQGQGRPPIACPDLEDAENAGRRHLVGVSVAVVVHAVVEDLSRARMDTRGVVRAVLERVDRIVAEVAITVVVRVTGRLGCGQRRGGAEGHHEADEQGRQTPVVLMLGTHVLSPVSAWGPFPFGVFDQIREYPESAIPPSPKGMTVL